MESICPLQIPDISIWDSGEREVSQVIKLRRRKIWNGNIVVLILIFLQNRVTCLARFQILYHFQD